MKSSQVNSGIEIAVSESNVQRIPSWFGEAVLLGRYWWEMLGRYWWESGLVGYEEEVRVERGRMGLYEVMDFVLILNSYAISGERSQTSTKC